MRQLNLTLRQQLEVAEAHIPPINEQIAHLATIDLIREFALLGEVIYDCAYTNDPTPTSDSLVLQAALLVPEGLGLIAWDREELISLRNQGGPAHSESRMRFVPFDQLGSALKAILLPHAEPLLVRLLAMVQPRDRT